MPEVKKHDPCADPLTPYWRDLVEAAFRRYPVPDQSPHAKVTAPQVSETAAERLPTLRGDERLLFQMWCLGVPSRAIAGRCGLQTHHGVNRRVAHLRMQGYAFAKRPRGWTPPKDWRSRLDVLLRESERSGSGAGGTGT